MRLHPLKALIAEDDPKFLSILVEDISNFSEFNIKSIVKTGKAAMKEIKNNKYDVLFLDVQLPGCSGIDILREVNQSSKNVPYVIYITGHEEHALEAFEVGAVDFLLKPYSFNRLQNAIQKLLKNFSYTEEGIERATTISSSQVGLACKTNEGIKIINFDQIKYLKSQTYKTFLHTETREFQLNKLLKVLEAKLPKNQFMRVHKQHIVNINKIASLSSVSGGKYKLYLNDSSSTELLVGRTYVKQLKKKLEI